MNKLDTLESPTLGEVDLTGAEEPVTSIPLIPRLLNCSGLYERVIRFPRPEPIRMKDPLIPEPRPGPIPPVPPVDEQTDGNAGLEALAYILLRSEQLRLDVDGRYPLNAASGTLANMQGVIVHWIATLTRVGLYQWNGRIWYKNGSGVASFPYTNVAIKVTGAFIPSNATLTYSGGGAQPATRVLAYKSPFFHPLNMEFDCAQGTAPVLDYQTYSHPNHPAALVNETLTIPTVYRRAGFDVTVNSGDIVPLAGAGANARWSDQEMHDAMQVYWSRFANAPEWAVWTFFASLSEAGQSLGGIMFDDIGPNQRQGCAIFVDSFISTAPPNDPAPAAWVRRMRFWTAVHEMGHTLNLAHSWQKALPVSWIPLPSDPNALSFMNYPHAYPLGGQSAFFANFLYRFSDPELLFLRHAPGKFVEPGNAAWFDAHGFQKDLVLPDPTFTLELRPPRASTVFEFLEPVVLDLKLTNVSGEPQIVDDKVLAESDGMTVIIKKKGREARQYVPFARRCYQAKAKVLAPGQTMTDSLFVAVGRNGWNIAEPGEYLVQVMLHLDKEDVLSAPLALRVERPKSYDEESLASDFFTDDVGRVLAFDGSRILTRATDTLAETAEMLKNRRVAVHAHVALGATLARASKLLEFRDAEVGPLTSASAAGGKVQQAPAEEKEARAHLEVLTTKPNEADQTLGRTDYAYYLEQHGELLGTKAAHQRLLELAAETSPEVPQPILARSRMSVGRSGRTAARAEK